MRMLYTLFRGIKTMKIKSILFMLVCCFLMVGCEEKPIREDVLDVPCNMVLCNEFCRISVLVKYNRFNDSFYVASTSVQNISKDKIYYWKGFRGRDDGIILPNKTIVFYTDYPLILKNTSGEIGRYSLEDVNFWRRIPEIKEYYYPNIKAFKLANNIK